MSNEKKFTNWLLLNKNNLKHVNKIKSEKFELTKSPIAGTYIIKEWKKNRVKSAARQFTRDEVELNNIAASFVEITPETRAKLESIPNNIGPYECKLCKTTFRDAFELAMHNCPRVVNIEYKYV